MGANTVVVEKGAKVLAPLWTVWVAWLRTNGLGCCLAGTVIATCHTRNKNLALYSWE